MPVLLQGVPTQVPTLGKGVAGPFQLDNSASRSGHVYGRADLRWSDLAVHVGRRARPLVRIAADDRFPGMYRVRYRSLCSDMANLTRAKDTAMVAALAILNGEEARRRGRPMRFCAEPLSDIGSPGNAPAPPLKG